MAARYHVPSDSDSSSSTDSADQGQDRMATLRRQRQQRGSGGWSDEPLANDLQMRRIQERDEERRQMFVYRKANDDWCKCEQCIPIKHAKSHFDLTCCLEHDAVRELRNENLLFGHSQPYSCITQHPTFFHWCLYERGLEKIAYIYKQAGHEEKRNNKNKKLRYVAYRQYTVWTTGRCGHKNRKEIPQCVTKKIRAQFPSNEYSGFQEASSDEIEDV